MKHRNLPWIIVVMLFMAACGQVVQIGSDGDTALPAPPGNACLGLSCGDDCPLTTCSANECPPSVGGKCTMAGVCALDLPACPTPTPDPRCAGLTCGAVCSPCDPADPTCTVEVDAGTPDAGVPDPVMLCDSSRQCQTGPVACN